MKLLKLSLCLAISLFSLTTTFAQEKSPVKFGKVSPQDFDLSTHNFDTSVSAVVISDVGSSSFEGNNKGWFTLVYKHQKRIKILNKNGFDAANININLYSNGTEEESLTNLQASTYNLENGEVVKTDLEDNSIFKEKLSKNRVQKKFTFPAVKMGSIIEYSYTINSDFLFNLQPWAFQGSYPRLWSEYNVSIPAFFTYVTLTHGYQPYYINASSQDYKTFGVTVRNGISTDDHFSVSADINNFRWVMKDVPSLKEEPFTSSLENYTSRIEFQLSQYRFPNMPIEDLMGNWYTVSGKMLKREDFGVPLSANNEWMNSEIKAIAGNETNLLKKTNLIYTYLRDNFTCTNHNDLYLNGSLKTIFKNKNGSVGDINLLLIAMLRHEKVQANPLILSTRNNGFANDTYPLITQYNYVIAEVKIDGNNYYLDASDPYLGFGKLSPTCYNGNARRISEEPYLINFSTDSLREEKLTAVIITADSGKIEGTLQTTLGFYESMNVREKIKEKGEADFFKKIRSEFNNDIEIIKPEIDSLKVPEEPLFFHYDFKINDMNEDIVYFNPMMTEAYKNNFLKAAERKYPVEMPYTFDETYIFSMDIPKDYVVDEIPKSAKVSFNEGEGMFEYLISKSDSQIQLRSRVMLKRANFSPEEYNSLRDFFGYVVKKHSEQIVFKKKK